MQEKDLILDLITFDIVVISFESELLIVIKSFELLTLEVKM